MIGLKDLNILYDALLGLEITMVVKILKLVGQSSVSNSDYVL